MRKIILTSVIGMALLTSCSKEEIDCKKVSIADCEKAWSNYKEEVKNAGQNVEQISSLENKYLLKYPCCGF